ncbi:MAG: DUF1653 domain-containing protein [Lachnospiraceae bacterium]|nr:DUF1653 domain-containing protein [Lachnospiraceae bacterium]
MRRPLQGETYRHFKGKNYKIVATAEHSETGEELVVYEALYGEHKIYARPLAMFCSEVDREKYPDVRQVYRFERTSPDVMDKSVEEEAQELNLDPKVVAFLDADDSEKRLNILESLHPRITDDMIDIMAMAIDMKIDEGDIEERYLSLRDAIQLRARFETSRLR